MPRMRRAARPEEEEEEREYMREFFNHYNFPRKVRRHASQTLSGASRCWESADTCSREKQESADSCAS